MLHHVPDDAPRPKPAGHTIIQVCICQELGQISDYSYLNWPIVVKLSKLVIVQHSPPTSHLVVGMCNITDITGLYHAFLCSGAVRWHLQQFVLHWNFLHCSGDWEMIEVSQTINVPWLYQWRENINIPLRQSFDLYQPPKTYFCALRW